MGDFKLMNKTIDLYLISGFLGAGKTTLVKQLLENSTDKKIGVIMNEFGKVSIDGPILKRDHMEMIELTRGSIFCSCLTMAFAEALVEMAGKDLDYLLVESSGLADPSNIGEILAGVDHSISNPYHYAGSITVVDASQFLNQWESLETVVKQIECADLTLINKIDLVEDKALEEIRTKIKAIQPQSQIIESSYFKNLEKILGKDWSGGKYPALKQSINTPENKPKSLTLHFESDLSKEALESWMRAILKDSFRVKGFVQCENQWWEVHGVGDCVDFYETDRKFESSTLVIISKIGPSIIKIVDSTWKSQLGIPMKMVNG